MVAADLKAPCDVMPASLVRSPLPARYSVDETFHQRIRRETRAAHDVVDGAMSFFDLKNAKAYARFLSHHDHALARLSCQVREEDEPDIQGMIDHIHADLRVLGVGRAANALTDEPLDGFGVAYVLRGSRMGARVLRARIGPGLPTHYMDFTPALAWREFRAALEMHAASVPETGRRHIIASAQRAFEAFGSVPDSMA